MEAHQYVFGLRSSIRLSDRHFPLPIHVTYQGRQWCCSQEKLLWRYYIIIIGKYNDIFKDEMGTFNMYEISLKMKAGVVPKFYKPRSIPLALKSKVEKYINRLISNILIPVDYSDWTKPPMLKPDEEASTPFGSSQN